MLKEAKICSRKQKYAQRKQKYAQRQQKYAQRSKDRQITDIYKMGQNKADKKHPNP